MTRVNEPLLRATLAQVVSAGAEWDQTVWRMATLVSDYGDRTRCKTTMCFAGWATTLDARSRNEENDGWLVDNAMLAKAEIDGYFREFCNANVDVVLARDDDHPNHTFTVLDPDNNLYKVLSAESRARRLLGLTYDQSCDLFCSTNRLADLQRMVGMLCEQTRD